MYIVTLFLAATISAANENKTIQLKLTESKTELKQEIMATGDNFKQNVKISFPNLDDKRLYFKVLTNQATIQMKILRIDETGKPLRKEPLLTQFSDQGNIMFVQDQQSFGSEWDSVMQKRELYI